VCGIEFNFQRFQLREQRSKLASLQAELHRSLSSVDALQQECNVKDARLQEQKKLLVDIDKERDAFQAELDRKTETIVQLTGNSVPLLRCIVLKLGDCREYRDDEARIDQCNPECFSIEGAN
jgi:chromosome segregation ATPase